MGGKKKNPLPEMVIRLDEKLDHILDWIIKKEKACEAHAKRTEKLETFMTLVLGGSAVVGLMLKALHII